MLGLPPNGWSGEVIGDQLGQTSDPEGVDRRSRVSHIIRRQQAKGGSVSVRPDLIPDWLSTHNSPSPTKQLDELILWVGDNQPSPNEAATSTYWSLSAWVGTKLTPGKGVSNLVWLLHQPKFKELAEFTQLDPENVEMRLTMAGWVRYHDLRQAKNESSVAFMAMKFNQPELDQVIRECIAPAVERAGFVLRTLTDGQPAGLIDDQMRTALRTCRFVISDLTHGSHGAYWEAGFGEGLGKPVIYTCRKLEWGNNSSHFDTNHLVTIVWDPQDLQRAGQSLTATIRATLPSEAKLTDD